MLYNPAGVQALSLGTHSKVHTFSFSFKFTLWAVTDVQYEQQDQSSML